MTRGLIISCLLLCAVLGASATNYQRTRISIARLTEPGQYIFLRGGNSKGQPIPIVNNMTTNNPNSVFAQTSKGDNFLDWDGAEEGQGVFYEHGRPNVAGGTPMVWTTNDNAYGNNVEEHGHGFTRINYMGEHIWAADIYMDCDSTDDGWFDFKGFMVDHRPLFRGEGWEDRINQETCMVSGEMVPTPGSPLNHRGKCGYSNVVAWSHNMCDATPMAHELEVLEWQEMEDMMLTES